MPAMIEAENLTKYYGDFLGVQMLTTPLFGINNALEYGLKMILKKKAVTNNRSFTGIMTPRKFDQLKNNMHGFEVHFQ